MAVVVCIGIYLLLLGVGVSAGRVRIRRRLPAAAIMVGGWCVGCGIRLPNFWTKGFRIFWVRIRKVFVSFGSKGFRIFSRQNYQRRNKYLHLQEDPFNQNNIFIHHRGHRHVCMKDESGHAMIKKIAMVNGNGIGIGRWQ